MKLNDVKVLKMGSRLGIAFPINYFSKRSPIGIKIIKENKQKAFITKFNSVITLRRDVENYLNLKHQDVLSLEIQEIKNLERTKELFYGSKIDMLSLIPQKTSKGYGIIVTEFDKNNEKRLRVWYSHKRGSGQQLEIRRFVEIGLFGSLLGQYQAEGTKHKNNTNKFRVEFTNKLLEEHRQFLKSLDNLGISRETIEFIFIYNPDKISNEQANDYVEKFKSVSNDTLKAYRSQSKGIGYRIVVRNTLLTEITLHGMNKFRNLLVNSQEYSSEEQILANNFLAKLLTGDGTLDIGYRGRDFPNIRIKIVDIDRHYLQDYEKIMKNLGFHPRINEKHIFVISSCSFKNLLYLYNINAFKNSNNWNKLLVAIALCLLGRRYYTYSRFLELIGYEKFGTSVISKGIQIKSNMASDWLNNKVKENLIVKNGYNSWSLTLEGESLAETLKIWSKDYKNLTNLKGLEDPFALLEILKIKKYKKVEYLPK
ncbi:MAG TPA: LAGLIDADG family homing endonuclease [Candidatus Nanoarchaeia archaeon]|nr:LAGLIDADG family homing endonuclease [Candidatus Nanoarchaeia archaeon]